jgi:transcriptional regulator with XRE-family HTH domain
MTPRDYKAFREKLGTPEQVARELGVTANTVARRERGEVPPTREPNMRFSGWLRRGRSLHHGSGPLEPTPSSRCATAPVPVISARGRPRPH